MYLVIGRADCPYCLKAKEFLALQREPYKYVDTSAGDASTQAHWKNFLKEELQVTTVPQVLELVGGYEELKEKFLAEEIKYYQD